MSEFMKEHLIEHVTSDRENWPLLAFPSAKNLRSPSSPVQTDARRKRAKSNILSAAVHVTENACAAAPIVKMHGSQAHPKFYR